MPFIPHTDEDVRAMLAAIGAADIDALFDEIPAPLRAPALSGLPPALSEMELMRLMQQRAESNGRLLNFIGAGAYEHHIPAALWQLASRGEFLTAYTPYQAEASQGTLQALYEYQSMMVALTGLDVCNASLYDGASALAEAVLMAVRSHKTPVRRVLIPDSVHPAYRRVVRTIVRNQNIEIVPVPFDPHSGRVAMPALEALGTARFAALVVPQPNFFGVIEDVDALRNFAAANGAFTIANVNPLSLALLKPPGEWGEEGASAGGTGAAITGAAGADICCGDGQPLGAPLAGGGPYFGFLTARASLVRQMPGRIVGRSVDAEGKAAYALTLQAREQHIRRAKATSNICTNQSLLAMAAAIHMALLGAEGLARAASACRANASSLLEHLTAVRGVERVFNAPFFHESVLRVPRPVGGVLATLRAQGILGGFDLTRDFPQLGNAMLVCATETKSAEDIKWYAAALENALS